MCKRYFFLVCAQRVECSKNWKKCINKCVYKFHYTQRQKSTFFSSRSRLLLDLSIWQNFKIHWIYFEAKEWCDFPKFAPFSDTRSLSRELAVPTQRRCFFRSFLKPSVPRLPSSFACKDGSNLRNFCQKSYCMCSP